MTPFSPLFSFQLDIRSCSSEKIRSGLRNLIAYLNRTILNPDCREEHLKILRDKHLSLAGQSGRRRRNQVPGLSVQDRKLQAELISAMRHISLISYGLDCITVGSGDTLQCRFQGTLEPSLILT